VTLKKFKSSVTDDGREVKFDEKLKPGISNLLTIHSALSGKSISDLESEFSGKGYGDFKAAVAEVVIAKLEPISKRTNELMDDPAELIRILEEGASKADKIARKTLLATYSALGLLENL
jgi:tryptophanyl-tRNA synthetase